MSQDIAQLITNLGVTGAELADELMVTDAVVLLKCVHPNGGVELFMAYGEGMSWLERLGMLRAAERLDSDTARGWGETPD